MLDDTNPLVDDINTFRNSNYLLDKEEFIVLVSRILVEFFSCLSFWNLLSQNISSIASLKKWQIKSVIINFPIVLYNQSKHSDVMQYLKVLQDLLNTSLCP